ncbi:hypothetical protein Poli38472_006514 [Pythium oligandrum]|uniref:CBF1-interacting co-repressor CIR N-terminal domain-containing protein n=1 Tax=Pythium oligandrum TaxID=41045 RepID=A0A8K1FD49_PYTOL|nr:hypothetical protein Poli38472_006514 [Pythium oligandrum]|eukprot:TMW56504.1 hypothetical protein Poli38472_006514 [Pythium oligandrum]
MSLAFLAKKSWHTANLRNVEKVWLAEQKHAAEEKKVAELKKNIEEERQLQELRKLQAQNGNKSAAVERLDWMYQGPMANTSERSTEDYLLGKEFKPTEADSDIKKLGDSSYGALALSKAALPVNDAFSRLNEDPMMLIRRQQQSAQQNILKNPVKMKKIKSEVEKLLKEKKEKKKAKKKLKKEAKKERKHGKSKRERNASVGSEDEEGRDDHRRSRSPQRSRYVVKKPDDGGKYGLISREGAVECKDVDRSTLGPSTKFLAQTRDKKKQEEEELRQKLSKSSRRDTMSQEEMLKRAAQMAEDAEAREVFLAKRAAEKRERLDEAEQNISKDPHFLKQLQDAAYVQNGSSVEDRLRRNAHYIQKRADAGNFLSK